MFTTKGLIISMKIKILTVKIFWCLYLIFWRRQNTKIYSHPQKVIKRKIICQYYREINIYENIFGLLVQRNIYASDNGTILKIIICYGITCSERVSITNIENSTTQKKSKQQQFSCEKAEEGKPPPVTAAWRPKQPYRCSSSYARLQ